MTERGAGSLGRGKDWLAIGGSNLVWDRTGLTVTIDEVAVPVPRRIRGKVRLVPKATEARVLALDAAGLHRWRPIAPCAEVEVSLVSPAVSWRGHAYFDTNWGDRALEDGFRLWAWSRAVVPGGTLVQYDITPWQPPWQPASATRLAMRYDAAGGVADLAPPALVKLPQTRWCIERSIGSQPGHLPKVIATLEDTPFYARSIVETRLAETTALAMHESLSLERFRSPWVQAMLPFRMPRAPSANRYRDPRGNQPR
jgi:carotenoid 1,2-hydratase